MTQMTTQKKQMKTPVGWIQLEANDTHLVRVDFIEKKMKLSETPHPILEEAGKQLEEYFAGTRIRFDLPIDPPGTWFEKKVWKTLKSVPFGKCISYKALASKMGRPLSARAVGNALGKNSLPIIVPCHRVVTESSKIGGFTGGIHRKRLLLDIESIQL